MGIVNQFYPWLTPIGRLGAGCLVAISTLMFSGCGGPGDSSVSGSSIAATSADTLVEYTVRGRVTQLPGGPEYPAREFMVRHEAIPEYRRSMAPGEDQMGMMSMAMAFPLGEGVSLEGIDAGDKVEMLFEAVYDGENGRLKGYSVRRLTLLPPETELDIAG